MSVRVNWFVLLCLGKTPDKGFINITKALENSAVFLTEDNELVTGSQVPAGETVIIEEAPTSINSDFACCLLIQNLFLIQSWESLEVRFSGLPDFQEPASCFSYTPCAVQ